MREKELEQRQMEMAKIVAALNLQQEKLQNILQAQDNNTSEMEALYSASEVEVLKKLKEKQEKEFYKSFLQAEMKEIDDITSARFRLG